MLAPHLSAPCYRETRAQCVTVAGENGGAAVLIRVENHALVDDLCAHFVRSNFEAATVGGGMIEVTKPDTSDAVRANREVLMHLEVWRVGNPGAIVEVVEV
jgi:hypothetical protein